MIFIRLLSAVAVLSLLISSSTVFAVSQNNTDSLNRLGTEVTKQKIVLEDSGKNKIQNSCQTAQANLKSLLQKEQRIHRERTETYLDVESEIDALRMRIKRQAIDVSGIATAVMSYREKSDKYDMLSNSYVEALSDTSSIDCHDNPEAFIAGLTLVKQKRALLLTNTTNLQDFVLNTVHEQFNLIKRNLKV